MQKEDRTGSELIQSKFPDEADGIFHFRDRQFDVSKRTYIVGILNVTSDSFSDGGRFLKPDAALKHAEQMIQDGADIIDVGGESTRPYSTPVGASEEMARVLPVVSKLAKHFDVAISIDTYKAAVAAAAIDAGAHIINDVTGLRSDPAVAQVAAKHEAGLILMHMKGTPRTMQDNPEYEDVVSEIKCFLREAIERACVAGVSFESIIVDPGVGFGKRLMHNLTIIKNLSEFKDLQRPIMVGPSRKSFVGQLLNLPVEERISGTLAAIALSILSGASMVRVHDVKQGREAAVIADAIARS